MRTLAASFLALLAVGCTSILPPVATPEPLAPTVVDAPPIQPGTQRLVLNVVDGPSDVFMLSAYQATVFTLEGFRVRTRTQRNLLCRTPCAADLPPGRYVLGFPMRGGGRRLEREEIFLGPQQLAHVRALGSYEGSGAGVPLGILGVTFGSIAMVLAAVFIPVGLAGDDEGVAIAGFVNLTAGLTLLIAGILALAYDTNVEQPGSGITFTM
ncbi:MAG: hypothetical protein JRH11_14995 [Deltaproteobacteria bacterium]|nr:hypothetical protein [Deltaproteobacteria bacterium]